MTPLHYEVWRNIHTEEPFMIVGIAYGNVTIVDNDLQLQSWKVDAFNKNFSRVASVGQILEHYIIQEGKDL